MADGHERGLDELESLVGERFNLTGEEKESRLPSGRQRVVRNRAGWAKWHLEDCGLLESTKRGRYRITPAGLALLDSKPQELSRAFLRAHSRRHAEVLGEASFSIERQENDVTPDERIEQAFSEINAVLKASLIEKLQASTPEFFEHLVVQLLLKLGYGDASQASVEGRTGDGGIDGIVGEDRLGLNSIYVQAKRWKAGSTVGEPDIRNFLGALVGRGAAKGVFITTSGFSEQARVFVARSIQQKIVLIDGDRLTELMIECGLGVSTSRVFAIKKVDSDFFDDE
jgi:restriction system protein